MVTWTIIERALDTYSLEDILEQNDLTEADALFFLVQEQLVTLPSHLPVGDEDD